MPNLLRKRKQHVYIQMLDVLVEACLENLVGPDPLGGERPAALHAELHFRVRQMVCGRKWRYFRDLQLCAAKRIAAFAVRRQAVVLHVSRFLYW